MNLTIERAELHHVALPLVRPFRTSFGVEDEHHAILVHLEADGLEGWGEAVSGLVPGYSYETVETAWHVMTEFFIPALFKAPVASIEDFRARLSIFRGHPLARAGIEMALWDMYATASGISLSEHLGGEAESVPVGVSLGIQADAGSLLELVDQHLGQGYARIKLKIEPGHDLEIVEAVRRAHPDISLQVDANCAYTLEDAEMLATLDHFKLEMIEQPLDGDDLLDHSELQRRLETPLCLDESIKSLPDARLALRLGSCRIVNIKAGRVGGLQEAVLIHDFCLANNTPVWCGGMLETGIGRAANLALASLPGFTLPNDISGTRRYYDRDLVLHEYKQVDGTMRVPQGPGLGVRIDGRALRDFTLRREITRAGATG